MEIIKSKQRVSFLLYCLLYFSFVLSSELQETHFRSKGRPRVLNNLAPYL